MAATDSRPSRWLKRLVRRAFPRKEVWVLGDSHAQYFTAVQQRHPLLNWDVKTVQIDGATASGLPNPNSTTGAGPAFEAAQSRITHDALVLFLLGEVDCGFTIWRRSASHDESVEWGLEQAVASYTQLLDRFQQTHPNLGVVSAPPPTIADGQQEGIVANLRSEVTAPLRERADLTARFNRAVHEHCQRHGLLHLDLHGAVTRSDGLPHPDYLNPDPHDHHLNPEATVTVLRRLLLEQLA